MLPYVPRNEKGTFRCGNHVSASSGSSAHCKSTTPARTSRSCAASTASRRRRSTSGRAATEAWGLPDLSCLKELESENAELKRLLADAMLDNTDLKGLQAKLLTPAVRRSAARVLIEDHGFAERQGCRLAGVSRSSFRREPVTRPRAELRKRILELANRHMQLGYRKLHRMLVRVGFKVKAKLFWRIYREEGLTLRRPVRKRIPKEGRERSMCPIERDQRWSLDFSTSSFFLANSLI